MNTNPQTIPMPQADAWVKAITDWHRPISQRGNALNLAPLDRDNTGYEPMHRFALLSHLRPPAGRVLDWLHTGGRNGHPFLYWRDADAAPHTHTEQLKAEPGWRRDQEMRQAVAEPVQTDGSPEGWLQLVLLRLLAGNTLVRWHSAYNSVALICSQDELLSQVEWQSAGKSITQNMNAATARAALALDVTPTVDLSDPHTACVGITRFTPWGGFYRQSWAMNRQGPHALRLEGEVQQLRYHCGVVF